MYRASGNKAKIYFALKNIFIIAYAAEVAGFTVLVGGMLRGYGRELFGVGREYPAAAGIRPQISQKNI